MMPPINNLFNQFLGVFVTLITFFVLLFVYTKVAGPIPFDVTSVTTTKADAFTVTGEGKVQAKPDSATVRLGVVAKGPTAEGSKSQLNTSINNVIEGIKALGIKEENIKTENFNVYPEYDNTVRPVGVSGDQKISGYTANTNIAVTVDSAEVANQVVDTASARGANQIGGVEFEVKDKEAALNQAREAAVKDAKKKAEDAARIAGFKLGKIINYSEGGGGGYPMPMMAKAEDSRMGSAPTDIQPGTNEIVMTVTLSYELK